MEGRTAFAGRLGPATFAAAVALMAAVTLMAALRPPAPALAADGSLTVEAGANEGAVYKAYRVFAADVDAAGNATSVRWPGDAMRDAVLAYLDGNGYGDYIESNHWGYEGAREAAPNAAQFCEQEIRRSRGSGSPSLKESGSFAAGLAAAVAAAHPSPARDEAGTATALPQGYYLVVTDPSSVGAGEAATAPVWVAVGESTEVAEKASAPSVKVEVRNSPSAAFAAATDALHGQEVECRITVALPSNLAAFASYPLRVDARAAGTYVGGSMAVSVAGTDVTERLRAGDGGSMDEQGDMGVAIDDLIALRGASAASGAVVVSYKAVQGSAPNAFASSPTPYVEHGATLSYPADPMGSATRTASGSARVYSYVSLVSLVDAATGRQAAPAGYTVQVAECADASLVGKYVNGFGEIVDAPATLRSSASGAARLPGLAAGKFRISQVTAPEGYPAQDADIVLEVRPAYDALGGVAEVSATVSGGYAAASFGSLGTSLGAVDATLCTVGIDSGVERVLAMPLTGLPVDRAPAVAAAALGAAGAAVCALALARRRRAAREGRGRS